MYYFSIESAVDLFGGGSIVQGKLFHFCSDHGILGRGFGHGAGQFHVDGRIEFHQTGVESKFDVICIQHDFFGNGSGCQKRDIDIEILGSTGASSSAIFGTFISSVFSQSSTSSTLRFPEL